MGKLTILTKLHERKIRLFEQDKHGGAKSGTKTNGYEVEDIEEKLREKSKEKCGGKIEINGIIKYKDPREGKKFYKKILALAMGVKDKIENGMTYLEAVYSNGNSEKLEIIENEYTNFKEFMIKFSAILSDFESELNESTKGYLLGVIGFPFFIFIISRIKPFKKVV
uniref:Uncharacterized protein n=1 Tax=Meloidogyne hapla TaxID=6305 RepID=A0A1I8BVG1_MELHA